MKTKVLTLAILLISIFSFAQKPTGWADLDNMKTVMKQSFPPLIKNNDLGPAKANAAELYEKALALESGQKPKAFRKKTMAEKFATITASAKEMKELVEKNASDEDVKNSLVTFHGAFAEIAHHEKAGHGKQQGQGKH